MRLKALVVLAAVAAAALPASAQGYRSCEQARRDNQIGGLIVGSVLGGVLGSNVAASGHRHDGTAVGAVLGGLIGSGVGADSVNCRSPQPVYRGPPASTYYPNPDYGGQRYPEYGYDPEYSGYYGRAPAGAYPVEPYSPYGYGPAPTRRYSSADSRPAPLYPNDSRRYNRDYDFAGSDCSEAWQTIELPDGTEVRRPVEVCRDARYGSWQVQD